MKPKVKITDAYILKDRLVGMVFNHPKMEDETVVVTSRIVNQDGNIVETLNTIYEVISWQEFK